MMTKEHFELFERLATDNADSEGANDTCKHANARPVSTWDCMPPINHWRCFDCGATWSKEDDGT